MRHSLPVVAVSGRPRSDALSIIQNLYREDDRVGAIGGYALPTNLLIKALAGNGSNTDCFIAYCTRTYITAVSRRPVQVDITRRPTFRAVEMGDVVCDTYVLWR